MTGEKRSEAYPARSRDFRHLAGGQDAEMHKMSEKGKTRRQGLGWVLPPRLAAYAPREAANDGGSSTGETGPSCKIL